MTATLARYVDGLDLPAEPGISARALRSVLRMMAKIAQDSGEFRYGIGGSKLARLCDYSLSVVRRAQRYLVDHGYLERVTVGGGRSSTRWRIVVDKLTSLIASGHTSGPTETHQTERGDTALERNKWFFPKIDRHVSVPVTSPTPPSLAELRSAPLCDHGDAGGQLTDGRPKCPLCRQGAPPLRR